MEAGGRPQLPQGIRPDDLPAGAPLQGMVTCHVSHDVTCHVSHNVIQTEKLFIVGGLDSVSLEPILTTEV